MADWRQIQARIRKAKAGSDPPGELAVLYEKTRDAMVAFELAQWHERASQNAEAARWYTTAAERFRRAQWKMKAEQALTRLAAGAPEVEQSTPSPSSLPTIAAAETNRAPQVVEQAPEPSNAPAAPPQAPSINPERGPRRRGGRRAGRRHHRRPSEPSQTAAEPAQLPAEEAYREEGQKAGARSSESVEPALGLPGRHVRARTVEPALASRLAHLESQLRRLLASPELRPDQSDQAPAGPGVFLLSDSDMTTHYHVEACQTLRIGIANLMRGDRSGRGASFKSRLAEHLEISDAQVAKYLKEHCVVRWLQLDEGAKFLAHFAISVLRPVLSE